MSVGVAATAERPNKEARRRFLTNMIILKGVLCSDEEGAPTSASCVMDHGIKRRKERLEELSEIWLF